MNVIGFKLRQDCRDNYFEVINKTDFEGMAKRYISRTGDYYCFFGVMESVEVIAAQRSKMIAHFDINRGLIKEFSPELGVTDSFFRNIVS